MLNDFFMFSVNPNQYRPATPKDIKYGATVYLVCDKSPRKLILHEMTIEKLGLRTVAPKVGHNAADHDMVVRQYNAERIESMRKCAHLYMIKQQNNEITSK